ncbi:hypothetical protein [Streptomyces sp. 8N706]|uniref:hypothetical protein n=1 Tax=Streptomyces sp. 8N706 TaxID=3457416 RepID=UPI003FD52428
MLEHAQDAAQDLARSLLKVAAALFSQDSEGGWFGPIPGHRIVKAEWKPADAGHEQLTVASVTHLEGGRVRIVAERKNLMGFFVIDVAEDALSAQEGHAPGDDRGGDRSP